MNRALTVRQPYADLIMAGVKSVENRSWPVPSTLPRHSQCDTCPKRFYTHGLGSHRHCPGLPERPGAWSLSRDLGPFPFTLGIHAAKTVDRDAPLGELDDRRRRWLDEGNIPTELVFAPRLGVLLGTVQVTGCHHADECVGPPSTWGAFPEHCSEWAEPNAYHWQLAVPEPLDEPIPMRGRQRLWRLPDDLAVAG